MRLRSEDRGVWRLGAALLTAAFLLSASGCWLPDGEGPPRDECPTDTDANGVDNNFTPTDADPVQLGNIHTCNDRTQSSGDVLDRDWFVLPATPGGTFTLACTQNSGTYGSTTVVLSTPSAGLHTPLACGGNNPPPTQVLVLPAGTYLVELRHTDAAEVATAQISFVPPPT